MKRVLIVCTGNICRSPMAAGLLRQRLQTAGLADKVEVETAGLFAQTGRHASPPGVALLAERGIDMAGHTARLVTPTLLDQADLILVMEEEQRRSLFYQSPQNLVKVLLLSELAGRHQDIPDPYGQDTAIYASTLERLDQLLSHGWERLLIRLNLDPNHTPL